MRKNKKKKLGRKKIFYTLGFFIFCVFGLTVAYSALSTTLNISGSAEVTSSSFGIKVEKGSFEEFFGDGFYNLCNSANAICTDYSIELGMGKIEKEPTITNNSIKDFRMAVQLPGDVVEMMFKITNEGSIPMTLSDVDNKGFDYTSINNSDADVEWAYSNLELMSGFLKSGGENEFYVGDVLCPGESIYFAVVFTIPEEVTTIPSGSIEITTSGVTFNFTQEDRSACS